MAETPPGAPSLLGKAVGEARRAADAVAGGLRRAGRFQRMRLGILGGWVIASLLALFIACPSTGPGNSIGADVQVHKDSLLGQQILVRNESDTVWTDVTLTLDGAWRRTERSLRPHEQVVLSPGQFERGGEPAPRELRPRSLLVECREGRARFDLR
jgi:hypothetical protein